MILHVACLPFPTYQGTQAALAAMLEASARAGRETHVLTYHHGARRLNPPYHVHRIPDFPKVRSLRSGPSLGKLVLDARCISATRRLVDRLRPDAVVAHHVEAALAARLAGISRIHYVAHTSLETELSVYFPRLPAPALRAAGRLVDALTTNSAYATATVAPALAKQLGRNATYLPVPWRVPEDIPRTTEGATILYAGNLDAYQGWEELIEALRILRRSRPDARLLIATESDPGPARRQAARRGVSASVAFDRLDGEAKRARVHAASTLAWIPRRTEGGLPIKMLDAFARGVPVIATERATAGLPVHAACKVISNDDPAAFASATLRLLDSASARRSLAEHARAYLDVQHSDEAYLAALDDLLCAPSASPRAASLDTPRAHTARAFHAR